MNSPTFPDKVYEASSERLITSVIVAAALFFLVGNIYSWLLGMVALVGLAIILWTAVFRVLITADRLVINRRFSPDRTIDLSQIQQARHVRPAKRQEGPLRLFYCSGGYGTYLAGAEFSSGQIEEMADEINRRLDAIHAWQEEGVCSPND